MKGKRLRYLVAWLILSAPFLLHAKAQMGESAAVLLERLQSPDVATRRSAAETLAQIGDEELEKILPTLLLALKDPDPDVRFYVATSLAVAAYGDEANAEALGQALPSLIEALNDEDARVREIVVGAIGLVKPQPPAAATQPLLELLDDQEPRVRETAVWSLGRISPVPPEVASAILKVLKEDESSDVRGEAASVLGEFDDPAFVSALREALSDRDTFVRREASLALGKIGPPAFPAVHDLHRIRQNPQEEQTTRIYAGDALAQVTADVKVPQDMRISYVMGSGDYIPQALEVLGVPPDSLSETNLAAVDLNQYDAVIVGVGAYAVRPDLKTHNKRLLDYVANGGVLIVHPQIAEYDSYAPYPYRLTEQPEEVSEEDFPVSILAPDNPIFNEPNKITEADFDGWVAQGGSHFLMAWDERYTPLLETHEYQEPQKREWLYTRYGKGAYIYSASPWHIQLEHGVRGAFRIFANMISLRRSLAAQGKPKID